MSDKLKEVSSVSGCFYYFKANDNETHLEERNHFTMNEYLDCRQNHPASYEDGQHEARDGQIEYEPKTYTNGLLRENIYYNCYYFH
jgi:hypothetical protein